MVAGLLPTWSTRSFRRSLHGSSSTPSTGSRSSIERLRYPWTHLSRRGGPGLRGPLRDLVDARWRTREVHVHNDTARGRRSTVARSPTAKVLDRRRPVRAPARRALRRRPRGSACTNTLPVHRLDLPRGDVVTAPAAYVQALDLQVRRLDQTYRRLDDHRFDYPPKAASTQCWSTTSTGSSSTTPGSRRASPER